MPFREALGRLVGAPQTQRYDQHRSPAHDIPTTGNIPSVEQVDPAAVLRAQRRERITNEQFYLAVATSPIVHFQSSVDPERSVAEELTIASLLDPPRDVIVFDSAGRAYYADTGNDVVMARKGSRRDVQDPTKRVPTGGAVPFETIEDVLRLIREYGRPALFDMPFLHLTLKDQQQAMTLIPVLQRLLFQLKDQNKCVIIRTPHDFAMPTELQTQVMTVTEKPLTNRDRERILTRAHVAAGINVSSSARQPIIDALNGLNETAANQALQYSVVAHGSFDGAQTVRRIGEFKSAMMTASGHYEVIDTKHIVPILGWEKFDKLFRKYLEFGTWEIGSSISLNFLLLVGMAGTGKTTKVAEIAHLLGRSGYKANVDRWMGMFHGQTEQGFAAALKEAEASAPNVILFDEIQRIFGGNQSDNKTSGGVMNRSFGTLLSTLQKWRNEGQQTLVIGTANTLEGLSPELLRRAMVLGVPLPGPRTRLAIWDAKLNSLIQKEAKRGRRIIVSPDLTKEDIEGITIRFSGDAIEKLIEGAAVFGDRRITWESLVTARSMIPRQEDLDPEEVERREANLRRYPSVTADLPEPVGTEYNREERRTQTTHRPDPNEFEILPRLGGRSGIVYPDQNREGNAPKPNLLRGPISLNID